MDLEIRPVTEEEFLPWMRAMSVGYGDHFPETDEAMQRPAFELDRTVAAFERGEPVSAAHSNPYRMVVPGGRLAAAGVNAVSVYPTHRRKGILTAMMAHQLRDVHERGEPLAALFSAESIIYGRFGYGPGSFHEHWTIERQHTAYATPFESQGGVRLVTPEEMRRVFPEVYGRATRHRPGATERPDFAWDWVAADPERWRRGATAYFHAVYEAGGRVDGYVTYRTKDQVIRVQELMSATDEAYAALWRYCFDVDLMRSTDAGGRPQDEPLPWLLADPDRLRRNVGFGMWLRLVDVREALSSRTLAQEGRLVLAVRDSFCPWNEGTYEVEGGPEGAQCRPSTEAPDLVLAAADLASAYLGTVSLTTLARAGRAEELKPGTLRQADGMFAGTPAPWCPYDF